MATPVQKNQANSIRNNIAQTGGNIIRAISNVNPYVGGTVASAVNKVGQALGNPLPETGATEAAQSKGGVAMQDPVTAAKYGYTPVSSQTAEKKAQATAGFPSYSGVQSVSVSQNKQQVAGPSPSGASVDPNQMVSSGLMSEKSMGANVGDIRDFGGKMWRWSGGAWEPNKSGGSDGRGGWGQDAPAPEPERLNINDIGNIAKGIPGMTDTDLAGLDMSKWENATADRTSQIAQEIEDTARANAEGEYGAIKEALGVQKGEIGTMSTQQRERLGKEKALTESGLTEKEQTETAKIEKEKTGFGQEVEQTKDELSTNWRDLSLEVQRVMRARGATDSAFSASQDTKLLMDFNKGLRQIAVKSTAAFQDFSDAVIETNKYYTREKATLDLNYDNALTDIDNWARQQVQSIQAQENVALNKKLADVRNAVTQANQLKAQVAQKIDDQRLALATWTYQYQTQLKGAVATAAAGKVEDAWKNIAKVRENADLVKTVLANGGEFTKKGEGESAQYFVHGYLPKEDGSYEMVDLPVTSGYVKTTTAQNAASIARGTPGELGQLTEGAPTYDETYSNLYGNLGANQQQPAPAPVTAIKKSLLDPSSWFK